MGIEYLPILKKSNDQFIVSGKVNRTIAHSSFPVLHATAIIITLLPDQRIILTQKNEKQKKKGRSIPKHTNIYDCFGGHMTYEEIPFNERKSGISLRTFARCACRELSEELLIQSNNGIFYPFSPKIDSLIPIGQYNIRNDHNFETSWAFLYPLEDYGPYRSEDTLYTSNGEESIFQPIHIVTFEQLCSYYDNTSNNILLDGIGRVLANPSGKGFLMNYIKKHR